MQITPTSLDKDKMADYLVSVLGQIEAIFEVDVFHLCEKHDNCLNSISQELLTIFSIRELKRMTDSLGAWFKTSLAPKRNSTVSLARWIAEIFLYIQAPAVEEPLVVEAIELGDRDYEFDRGIPHTVLAEPKVEVLEPEKKPVYTISLYFDCSTAQGTGFAVERVNTLPPFLIGREGELFRKVNNVIPHFDAIYAEIKFEHLSNIAQEHGQLIELLTDNLVVYAVKVHGNPPPYVVHKKGVYKRLTWGVISWGLRVKYSQVVSDCLSNIVIVGAA